MAVITIEQLENAAIDAGTVEKFSNGVPQEVTPRYGDTFPNMPKLVETFTAMFNDFLASNYYEPVPLVYVDGTPLTVDRPTQLISRTGSVYRIVMPSEFPVHLTGTWATDLAKVVDVTDQSLRQALALPDGYQLVGNAADVRKTNLADSDIRKALGRAGMQSFFAQGLQGASVLAVGDSNAASNGSHLNTYRGGWLGRFLRSLMNNFDKQNSSDRGYMFETWLNPYQQLQGEPGWSFSGATFPGTDEVPIGNVSGQVMRFVSGDWAERTGIEVSQGRVYFVPGVSGSGTLRVSVDGVPAYDVVVDSTGYSSNFNLTPISGGYIQASSKVRFTCISGTIDVTGFRLIRAAGSSGPLVYGVAQGSQGFSDFYATDRLNALTSYVLADQPDAPKLVMCGLGTNHFITTVGKLLTPAQFVVQMQAFITAYTTKLPGCQFWFWIPPEPDVVMMYPYADYVRAIIDFAATKSNVYLSRMDDSGIKGAQFFDYPDNPVPGVHYNDPGHAAIAHQVCGDFGISVNTALPAFTVVQAKLGRVACTADTNWSTADAIAVGDSAGGEAKLYGTFTKVTGSDLYFGYVPAGYPPAKANTIMSATDQAGISRGVLLTADRRLKIIDGTPIASIMTLWFAGQSYLT